MTSTSNDFSKILDWPHGSPFPLQRGGTEGLRQSKILAEVNYPAEVVLGPCPASQEIDNFSRDHSHTATLSPSPTLRETLINQVRSGWGPQSQEPVSIKVQDRQGLQKPKEPQPTPHSWTDVRPSGVVKGCIFRLSFPTESEI